MEIDWVRILLTIGLFLLVLLAVLLPPMLADWWRAPRRQQEVAEEVD